VSPITIVSDAPNCGVTYDRNSFIVQATVYSADADGEKSFITTTTGVPRLPIVGSIPFLNGETGSRIVLSSVKLIPKYGDVLGFFLGPVVK
jgi:hypothetical protein